VSQPVIDLQFPHAWQAEILRERPRILPQRRFVYPRDAEEVERSALELMVRPQSEGAQPFLATCALGFRDPAVAHGIWSTPDPAMLCAVSGGYAYIIDTAQPEQFTMILYRPVLQVRPLPEANLLLFVGHHAVLAWGVRGQAWQSSKLSDEGVTITGVGEGLLRGRGWEMMSDQETEFALDLRTGMPIPLGPGV
jgi:hypothetical protein